jgi:hypothetical protein
MARPNPSPAPVTIARLPSSRINHLPQGLRKNKLAEMAL